jgi:hypothetical protein
MADGRSGGVLAQLVEELNARRIRVVDLTTTLGPETPVIDLPPIFAPSPGLTLTEISRYDARGPAWYWNILTWGDIRARTSTRRSTGSRAKIYPRMRPTRSRRANSSAPACVIDVTRMCRKIKTSC